MITSSLEKLCRAGFLQMRPETYAEMIAVSSLSIAHSQAYEGINQYK